MVLCDRAQVVPVHSGPLLSLIQSCILTLANLLDYLRNKPRTQTGSVKAAVKTAHATGIRYLVGQEIIVRTFSIIEIIFRKALYHLKWS